MKNRITLIFIVLIALACKEKVDEKYIDVENNSEIVAIQKTKTEKVIDSTITNVVTKNKPDCELENLVAINSRLEKGIELYDLDFMIFFHYTNSNCSNNFEYSEYNNELVFKMLDSNPIKFVAFLSRGSKEKMEFVLTQLRNPIHDGIELNEIYRKLDKSETEDAKTKELVAESIKTAIKKNN